MDQLTGGEGGEEKDEGRVGVQSDNRPTHHKQPRRRGGKPGLGTEGGAIFTELRLVYCEAVIHEAAGRVGVPKQRLCASSVGRQYTAGKFPSINKKKQSK